jgi:homoserine O-succinyltransferase
MPAVSKRSTQPSPRITLSGIEIRRLTIVNNMPEAAREETAKDLQALFGGEQGDLEVEHRVLTERDVDLLMADPPEVLIVTGSEPRTERIVDEPYWGQLARLLRWAPTATRSLMLSCLTAHAYLLLADGIERVRLDAKCHGAFRNEVATGHVLTRGLPTTVAVPHSRSNGVPTPALEAAGWEIPLQSDEAGWTVATRLEGTCRVMLAQGHPEYGTETLLREHRRDVRRFQAGERPSFPDPPLHYLGPEGSAALSAYRALLEGPDGERAGPYPFDVVAPTIVNGWREPARRLAGNWLADAAQRSTSMTES